MRVVVAILHLALHSVGSIEPGSPLVRIQLATRSKHPVQRCKVMDNDLASSLFGAGALEPVRGHIGCL